MHLDIKRLMQDADARIVAFHIGMKLFANGRPVESLDISSLSYEAMDSTYWTYCPFHERVQGKKDHHPSNCVVHPKSIMCFAGCGSHNIIEMVCEFCKVPKGRGYEIIAEAMGGVQLYLLDGKAPDYPKLTLKPEEQRALMLSPSNGTPLHLSMYEIYSRSKRDYYSLIEDRAREMLDEYQKLLAYYGSMDAPRASMIYDLMGPQYFDGGIYEELEKELKERIKTCANIVQFFDKKKTA